MSELNYMKGQLKMMPKKQVVDVYYKLQKANGKGVKKEDIKQMDKDLIISCYLKERNNSLIFERKVK